jgi:hypothetical protein
MEADNDILPVLAGRPGQNSQPHKLTERWSVCCLVSAIVNLIILVTAAVALLPLNGGDRQFTLIATAGTDGSEIESLSLSADTAALDFGVSLEEVLPEVLEPQEVRVDLSLAGGSFGQGPGGWQQGSGGDGSGSGTDYFGTVAYGNRFVYILDKSNSMNRNRSGIPAPDSRFARARYELLRSVDKLAPYQSFYVILFSNTTRRMFEDESPAPVTIPATRENKERLRKWLEELTVGGGTDPRDALFLALAIAPDAIFMLSDGEFNGRGGSKRSKLFSGDPKAEELVQRMNHAQTPIHTFAYEDPASKQRMFNLAEITGGEYKYIPPVEEVVRQGLQKKAM